MKFVKKALLITSGIGLGFLLTREKTSTEVILNGVAKVKGAIDKCKCKKNN